MNARTMPPSHAAANKLGAPSPHAVVSSTRAPTFAAKLIRSQLRCPSHWTSELTTVFQEGGKARPRGRPQSMMRVQPQPSTRCQYVVPLITTHPDPFAWHLCKGGRQTSNCLQRTMSAVTSPPPTHVDSNPRM